MICRTWRTRRTRPFLDHWLLGDDSRPSTCSRGSYGQLNMRRADPAGAAHRRGSRRSSRRRAATCSHCCRPNIERFNRLFDTAVKGSALETDDKLGLQDAAEALELEGRTDRWTCGDAAEAMALPRRASGGVPPPPAAGRRGAAAPPQ